MSGEELWLRDVIDMAFSCEGILGTRAAREVERAHPVECTEDVGDKWQGICTRVDQKPQGNGVNKSPEAARGGAHLEACGG